MLFTVIVPFLNEERWLPILLAHLQQQTFAREAYELIFVDNGSTDRSLAILAEAPGITLLHEPVRDPYIARNRGIAAARGEYCVFLDADCLPAPDWLEQLARIVPTRPEAIHLGYIALPSEESTLLRAYEDYYDSKLRYLIEHRMSECYFGHGGNMVLSTKLLADVGPFPPMPIVGDTEIIHRAIGQKPETDLSYIPTARVTHAEVMSFRDCLQKIYETGGYSQRFVEVSDFATVPMRHRVGILFACARQHGYSPVQFFQCCAMLAAGWAAFTWGRLRA